MPTYDYICENCGHEFERFQPITANPIRKCPLCGRRKVKRLLGSGSGLIFKGSGFYQTDYRSENYKNSEKSEKSGTDTDTAKNKKGTKDSETADKTKPSTTNKKKPA